MHFITCFTKIEKDSKGWLEMGSQRTFGYYQEFKDAEYALNHNVCDLHECTYKYAILEKIGEGIHPDVEERRFYEYDFEKQGFFEIPEPAEFKGVCNIALG